MQSIICGAYFKVIAALTYSGKEGPMPVFCSGPWLLRLNVNKTIFGFTGVAYYIKVDRSR
jgi:hypothetical protein